MEYRRRSHYSQARRPHRGNNWKPSVPNWEKNFCKEIGKIAWGRFLKMKEDVHLYSSILEWNDTACEEAFQNAKKRYWAMINGLSVEEYELPDPDLYLDVIDWDAEIAPELIQALEYDDEEEYVYDPNREPVVVLPPEMMPYYEYSTGWGAPEEDFPKPPIEFPFPWEVKDTNNDVGPTDGVEVVEQNNGVDLVGHTGVVVDGWGDVVEQKNGEGEIGNYGYVVGPTTQGGVEDGWGGDVVEQKNVVDPVGPTGVVVDGWGDVVEQKNVVDPVGPTGVVVDGWGDVDTFPKPVVEVPSYGNYVGPTGDGWDSAWVEAGQNHHAAATGGGNVNVNVNDWNVWDQEKSFAKANDWGWGPHKNVNEDWGWQKKNRGGGGQMSRYKIKRFPKENENGWRNVKGGKGEGQAW